MAEFFSRLHVGHMHFHNGHFHAGNRVADRIGIVRERTGIEDNPVEVSLRALDERAKLAFEVALLANKLRAPLLCKFRKLGVDVVERFAAVNALLALSRLIDIHAFQNKYFHWFSSR